MRGPPISTLVIVLLLYAAFVSLGLPDGAFGVAWPSLRHDLGQRLEAAGALSLLGTTCAAASGFASARVLARLGTLRVVLLSGLLTGFSLLGFALASSFTTLLLLTVPLGFGAGSVDAGLNHHAAANYSSRHMNWLHAAWGVGATLGPLAVTAAMSRGFGWRGGYLIIAGAQLTVVFVLFIARHWWQQAFSGSRPVSETNHARSNSTPPPRAALLLAPGSYGLYVGAETAMGIWIASILRDGRSMDASIAGSVAAGYYAAITVGRIFSGLASNRIGNRRMVRWGMVLALLGIAIFACPLGVSGALGGVLLLGLGFSPIYPCLMHETPLRFDAETVRRVIGRQVACGALGGMLLPPLLGLVAGRYGLIWVAPLVGVLILMLYAVVALLDRIT